MKKAYYSMFVMCKKGLLSDVFEQKNNLLHDTFEHTNVIIINNH